MIGTATTPLITAVHTSNRIGLMGKKSHRKPNDRRRQNNYVKSDGLWEFGLECRRPSEEFRHRIGGRACKHRNGKQSGSDNPQSKKQECKIAGYGSQRLRSLGSRLDIGNAVRMQRARGSDNDEIGDKVGRTIPTLVSMEMRVNS